MDARHEDLPVSWRRGRRGDDRGFAILLVALCMVVLLLMAAFAVDVGMVYNERRQDQSAVDSGALGGALRLELGPQGAIEEAAAIVRENLDTTYTDAAWRTMWSGCVDPGHHRFTGTVLGAATTCISVSNQGRVRILLPPQEVPTAFARVVGIDTLRTRAGAEASVRPLNPAGVLPFAILVTATDGGQICLRTATGGQAQPPCDGPSSGNFGALEVPQYGNAELGTENIPCNLNKSDQLAVNIAVGIDHFIRAWNGVNVQDTCAEPFGPTMLNTFQGIANGLFEGLIAGVTVGGRTFDGRVTLGENPSRTLQQGTTSWAIDDRPLWEYIPTGKGATVPTSCRRETFAALPVAQRTANLGTCLDEWRASGPRGVLFDLDADGDDVFDIMGSARFGYTPQFLERDFPNGNGFLRIKKLRAVFLQGMWFNCNGNRCGAVYHPGEGTAPLRIGNGRSLDQISAFLVPDAALPPEVLDNGPDGALGPYAVELVA